MGDYYYIFLNSYVRYTTPDKIFLNPIDAPNELISIDRLSYEITLEGKLLF